MRAVAERLVLRGAAAAQRVALSGGNRVGALPGQRDRADDRVRSVLRHGDPGRVLLRRRFDVIDRIAQRAGRTLADCVDDCIDARAVGIDPRLAAVLEDGSEVIGAASRVRADRTIVEDRDFLAAVDVALRCPGLRLPRAREAVLPVRPVAERLCRGTAAAAKTT